jgi:hypothetical protein
LRRFLRANDVSSIQSRNNGRWNARLIVLIKNYRTVYHNTGTILFQKMMDADCIAHPSH